jgi:hypothetical protein
MATLRPVNPQVRTCPGAPANFRLCAITRTGAIKTVRELVAFWHARPEALAPRRSRREPHRFGPLCVYRIRGRGSAPVALFGGPPQKHKAQERSVRDWLKVASTLCLRSMETLDSALSKVEISNRRSSLN